MDVGSTEGTENSSVTRFRRKPKIYRFIRINRKYKIILTHVSKGCVFFFFPLDIVALVGKQSRGEILATQRGKDTTQPRDSRQNYIPTVYLVHAQE